MEKILVYREMEAIDDDRGDQQRHEEVEILIEQTATFRCYGDPLMKPRIGRGYRDFSSYAASAARYYYI